MEIYYGRSLGIALITLAIMIAMLTGSVPLTSSVTEAVTTDDADPKAPYAVPTLMI